jgi:hypothetical protein
MILLHIPVGTDVYATLSKDSLETPEEVVEFWKSDFPPAFLDAIAPHEATIRGIFAAHTHMDQFLLVPLADSGTLTFEHVTPAISPLFGNNPAFEVFTYDRDDLAVSDYTTYYLPVAGASEEDPPSWQVEYRFSEAYSVPDFSVPTLTELWPHLRGAGDPKMLYERYYDAGNEAATDFSDDNWFAYWCAIGAVTASDFLTCFVGR